MIRRYSTRVVTGIVAALMMSVPTTASGAGSSAVIGGCEQFGPPPANPSEPHESRWGMLSPDGRFVVFASWYPLADDDTNNAGDVYRYDRQTGELRRLNLENTGGELRHGALPQGMSDDGDRVLFLTGSPDLAGEGSLGQVYVRKLAAARTELVSANIAGKPTNGPVAAGAGISADGRWVVFSSQGTDLVASDPRPVDHFALSSDVYLRDLQSKTTEAVTAPFGSYREGTNSFAAAISRDGRFVAFTSGAPWTTNDTSSYGDAFVWDRETRTYELISVDPSGRAIGGTALDMSDDGNLVAFSAVDLDGDGGAVYLRDRAARTTRRLLAHRRTSDPSVSISGDGRVVAIQTLDPVHQNDVNGRDDIVLIDTLTGASRPVAAADPACSPDAGVFRPGLSHDGGVVVVETAWDHVGEPERREIFTFDTAAGLWTQITPQVIEADSPGGSGPPGLPPTPPIPDDPADGGGSDDGALPPPVRPSPARGPSAVSGYWMLTTGGAVHAFGGARHHGDGEIGAADIEATPDMDGYWILHFDGLVTAHGEAWPLGDAELGPDEIATTMSATPTGEGYWVFTSAGRVLPFGDAPFFGDMSDVTLNGPVLDSVVTPTGQGYFMVADDGGIFAFGDARFAGSMGGRPLNQPVASMAPDPDGRGYWLVSSDGGIFAFDAPFFGSMGNVPLNEPVTGIVPAPRGYLMVAADGGVFAFGAVPFYGSLGADPPPDPVIAVALTRGS